MKSTLEQIVNAILYEGYILYPYRASSKKNQRERFTFGRVYPQIFSEKENGAEPCVMQAECLLRTNGKFPMLKLTLGFLQPVTREIGRLKNVLQQLSWDGDAQFENVAQLEVAGKTFRAWTEANERKVPVVVDDFKPFERTPFTFAANENRETICDDSGGIVGMIFRREESLEGLIEIKITIVQKELYRVCVRVVNLSPVNASEINLPEKILRRTFASTHFTLEAEDAEFVSLLETPPELKAFAEDCKNIGCWPVLVGDQATGERTTMLASPIILYDYPQIAPESAGEFFDGTEIDEMLALRVLTMSDAEKKEMQAEEFSRRILERTSSLNQKDFQSLHGTMHQLNAYGESFLNPAQRLEKVSIDGVELRVGDKVIIRPKRRADAFDLMLSGKLAVIEALEQNLEGEIHLAVVLKDDPGLDLGMARQPGHRFFYAPDEVEPVKVEVSA